MAALVITNLSFSNPTLSCKSPTMLACLFDKDLKEAYIESLKTKDAIQLSRQKTNDAIQLSRQKTAERVEFSYRRSVDLFLIGCLVGALSIIGLIIYEEYHKKSVDKEIIKTQLEAAKAQNTPFSEMIKAEIQKKESGFGIFNRQFYLVTQPVNYSTANLPRTHQ